MIQRKPAAFTPAKRPRRNTTPRSYSWSTRDAGQEEQPATMPTTISGAECHRHPPRSRVGRRLAAPGRAPHAQAQALDRDHLDALAGARSARPRPRSSTRRARTPCPSGASARRRDCRSSRSARRRPPSARAAACARPRTRRAPRTAPKPATTGTSTGQNDTRQVATAPGRSKSIAPPISRHASPTGEQHAERGHEHLGDQQARRRAAAAAGPPRRRAGSASRSRRAPGSRAPSDAGQDQARLVELDVEPEQAGHQEQDRDVRVDEHVEEARQQASSRSRAAPRPRARARCVPGRPRPRGPSSLREQLARSRATRSITFELRAPRPAVTATDSRTAFAAHSTLRLRCFAIDSMKAAVKFSAFWSAPTACRPRLPRRAPPPPMPTGMRRADARARRHRRDVAGHRDEGARRRRPRAAAARRTRSRARARSSIAWTMSLVDASRPPGVSSSISSDRAPSALALRDRAAGGSRRRPG